MHLQSLLFFSFKVLPEVLPIALLHWCFIPVGMQEAVTKALCMIFVYGAISTSI